MDRRMRSYRRVRASLLRDARTDPEYANEILGVVRDLTFPRWKRYHRVAKQARRMLGGVFSSWPQ